MGNYLTAPVTAKESEDGGEEGGCRYGATAMQGWRVKMEDAHVARLGLGTKQEEGEDEAEGRLALFGVFDGHGGAEVAQFCAAHIVDVLRRNEAFKRGAWEEALPQAFLRLDELLVDEAGQRELHERVRAEREGARARGFAGEPEVSLEEVAEQTGISAVSIREYVLAAWRRRPPMPAEQQGAAAAAGASGSSSGMWRTERRERRSAGRNGEREETTAAAAAAVVGRRKRRREEREEEEDGAQSSGQEGQEEGEEDVTTATTSDSTSSSSGSSSSIESAVAAAAAAAPPADLAPREGDEDDEEEDDDEEEEEEERQVILLVEAAAEEGGGDEEEEEEEEEEALRSINFLRMKDQLVRSRPGYDSGTTAAVALLVGGRERLVVANAGDSRCVLSRGGRAVELSHDHKPDDPGELARIRRAGGSVADGRVEGNLNLSRAIGDLLYKQERRLPPEAQMISALPDVRSVALAPEDEFFVLACDGIWNVLSSQQVVDFVAAGLRRLRAEQERGEGAEGETAVAARLSQLGEELCDRCCDKEMSEESDGAGCDNMTVLIVLLPPAGPRNHHHHQQQQQQIQEGAKEADAAATHHLHRHRHHHHHHRHRHRHHGHEEEVLVQEDDSEEEEDEVGGPVAGIGSDGISSRPRKLLKT